MNRSAIPPYPEFTWEEFFWITTAPLRAWTDLLDSDTAHSDRIKIVYAPEGRGDDPLTETEMMLVEWIIDHEEVIYAVFMKTILEQYPSIREEYTGYFDPEEADEILPEVSTIKELLPLLSITSINVHPIDTDGIPFFGIELLCSWDKIYGMGILMHGTSLLEIGGIDTAILMRKAERYK